MKRIVLPLVLLTATPNVSLARQWIVVETGAPTEFRGLDAADAGRSVWATGRGGWVARSTDGGTSWSTDTIPGAGGLFLVDVHAVSPATAFVLGTSFDGGLARIYRTDDGGRTWRSIFEDSRAGAFYDGLAFWNDSSGIAFGDPVDGAFTVAVTRDGRSWTRVPPARLPAPGNGEAGFAASGRAIAALPGGIAMFGTGGAARARVIRTADFGESWTAIETPLPAGASAGIFALDFADDRRGLAVGGDYQLPGDSAANVLHSADGGMTWTAGSATLPRGVKYGVASVPGTDSWVAVAPAGAGRSDDGGRTWSDLGLTGFNTVHFETATAGWMAGTEGRIAVFRR